MSAKYKIKLDFHNENFHIVSDELVGLLKLGFEYAGVVDLLKAYPTFSKDPAIIPNKMNQFITLAAFITGYLGIISTKTEEKANTNKKE